MLREGSLRQDLAATLKPMMERGVNLQRLILVTDSMSPDDVEERGHMDHVVRRAIALGMSPMQAIQSVTLNPATYSGLEQEVGGIAPGRFADLLLLDNLEGCRVREVIIGGKIVARDGSSLVRSTPCALPSDMFHALGLRPIITAEMFKIACAKVSAKVRVMELVNSTITAQRIVELNTSEGAIAAGREQDLLKVAMLDRHHGTNKIAFGFLRGFGAKIGAVGLTTNLDENAPMIIGCDDADMALCANALIDAGGGMAIVHDGQVLDKLDFPLGGIFSLAPWQTVGVGLRRIQARLREMGSPFDKPIFALSFLPFVTLPALRITARGLVDAKERRIVSLFAD
jgi:adenine deaminase